MIYYYRLSNRWKNSKAFVIAVSQVLAAPAIAGVLLAPSPKLSYGLVALAYITAETWLGPAAAIVQVNCSYKGTFFVCSSQSYHSQINLAS